MLHSPTKAEPSNDSLFPFLTWLSRRREAFAWWYVMLALAWIAASASVGSAYDLAFSTCFGGSEWEHARDVAVDRQGNIDVVGGTASADLPTAPGAYSRVLQTGGSQAFGPYDVFVVKFSPDGDLLWSTLIGGPGTDRLPQSLDIARRTLCEDIAPFTADRDPRRNHPSSSRCRRRPERPRRRFPRNPQVGHPGRSAPGRCTFRPRPVATARRT